MPMLIEHIDKIARDKQRDVLVVIFGKNPDEFFDAEWEEFQIRQQIIEWLEAEGIAWRMCGHFANERLMCGYRGQIYIDVPFDRNNPTYLKVEAYLETPDGSPRYQDATFCYVTLKAAMKNAHHDEPGFWDRWAENF